MRKYIFRRFIHTAILIVLIVILNFFFFRLMPGDPTFALLDPGMPPGVRDKLIAEFGLDAPIHTQFFAYLKEISQGNLGVSFYYKGISVSHVVFGEKLVNTVILMGVSITLSILFGSVLGVIAGWRQHSKFDVFITNFALVAYSMPVFWSGILVLLGLGYHLGMIPLGGTATYGVEQSILGQISDRLTYLIGPVLVLCILFTGQFLIIMRNTIADIFNHDYMKVAEAKGLSISSILFKYAMRNALLPTISLSAALSSLLIGGATMTEVVFSYNGIGRLIYNSVLRRDYPTLQGVFIVMALLVVSANFVADMLYVYLDPRIRY